MMMIDDGMMADKVRWDAYMAESSVGDSGFAEGATRGNS